MARMEDSVWKLYDEDGGLCSVFSADSDDTQAGVLEWWNDFERRNDDPFAVCANLIK